MYGGRLFGPYPRAEVDRDAIGALMAGRTPTQEDSP